MLSVESDEESTSTLPVFENFYNEGVSASIANMPNFSPYNFSGVWARASHEIGAVYSFGRRQKSQLTAENDFSMLLAVLKQGGQWYFPGKAL